MNNTITNQFDSSNYSGYRYDLNSTRTWIRIANILGLILAVVGYGAYCYYAFNPDATSLTIDSKVLDLIRIDINKIPSIIIMSLLTFICISSIIFCIALIYFVSTASDDDLVANKWTLSVLSLTAGGFFTPLTLTRLPNVEVKSTRNARATIAKWFGLTGFIASVISAATIGIYWGRNNLDAENKQIVTTIIVVLATVAVFTFITCLVFFRKDTEEKMANNTGVGSFARVLAVLYTIVATILLVLQFIYMIIKIIAIFADMFEGNKSALERFLTIISSGFQITMTIWTMSIIIQVINGIWKKDGKPEFKFSEKAQKHLQPKL